MKKIKVNKKIVLVAMGILLGITASVGYAAFMDKGKILGSSFTVGSADLKFLKNVSLGTEISNLTDELAGPAFNGIAPNWTSYYYVKLFNNASTPLNLTTNAYYETANDPDDLRSVIFVEPFNWSDDGDGIFEEGELGTSYGRKTIVKWKTEGFVLGPVAQGSVKGIVLKFSTDALADSKQGKSGVFDFEFGAVNVE